MAVAEPGPFATAHRARLGITSGVVRDRVAPTGSPVTPEYEGPFTFTGTLHSVTLDVSGELIEDPESELRVHLARQ